MGAGSNSVSPNFDHPPEVFDGVTDQPHVARVCEVLTSTRRLVAVCWPAAMSDDTDAVDAAWGSDDDDAEWDEWGADEEGGLPGPAVDPFTGEKFSSASECLQHMATAHQVDVVALGAARGHDQYGCIRLINYLRKKVRPDAALEPQHTVHHHALNQCLLKYMSERARKERQTRATCNGQTCGRHCPSCLSSSRWIRRI